MPEVIADRLACATTGTLLTNNDGVWTIDNHDSPLYGKKYRCVSVTVEEIEDEPAETPETEPDPDPETPPAEESGGSGVGGNLDLDIDLNLT